MDLMVALTALGFTEYEAKVYLALLREHPATGYQLGKQAGRRPSACTHAAPRSRPRSRAARSTGGCRPRCCSAAQMLQHASEVLLVLDDTDLEALRAEVGQVCEHGLEVSTLLTGSVALDCGQVARRPPLESQRIARSSTLLRHLTE
jgi:Cd2+/Zn2+-exporting ATPase